MDFPTGPGWDAAGTGAQYPGRLISGTEAKRNADSPANQTKFTPRTCG